MPLATFPFEPEPGLDLETSELNFIYRPYLFVKLSNKRKWSSNFIKALVDSGADYNVFPAPFATELGIEIKKGIKRKTMSGVGYGEVEIYGHIIKVKVDGVDKIIETPIFFGSAVQIPLLGRHGFFNYFKEIGFNVKAKKLILSY